MYNPSVNKSEAIKLSIQETKEQRKSKLVRTYELKLQNLKNKDIEVLNRLSLEAKWLRNYVVADIDNRLNNDAWKLREVEIKVKDKFEKREIKYLSSQMRQGVIDRIRQDLLKLHKSKEKGNKVGALKFKSEGTFKCKSCEAIIDRDINSARNMVLPGEKTPLKNLPTDCWEVTPVERKASARIMESNPHIRVRILIGKTLESDLFEDDS